MKITAVKNFMKVQLLRVMAMLFTVKVANRPRDRKIFTEIWHTAWLGEGYAVPGELIIEKYSKYDKFSVDLLVKFLGIIPLGTIRLIRNNSEVGLPVLNDFEVEKCWQRDNDLIEITLLAVKRKYRSRLFGLTSLILIRETVKYCKNNNMEGGIMACDKRLFFLIRRKLGFPIMQIGPEKFYEGSMTYPAFINAARFYKEIKERNPFLDF
jgi:hypothetical protein